MTGLFASLIQSGGPFYAGPAKNLPSAIPRFNVRDNYDAGSGQRPGAQGDGTTDDTAAFTYWNSRLGGGGGILDIPARDASGALKNNYRLTSGFSLPDCAIWLADGPAVRLVWDVAFTGDCFTMAACQRTLLYGFIADSSAQRTAGALIRVQGGNQTYKLYPSLNIALGGHQVCIHSDHQFNVIIYEDLAAGGDWSSGMGAPGDGGRGVHRNVGGIGIDLNTSHGASQVFEKLFFTGLGPAGGAGNIAIRANATGDATFSNVESFNFGGNSVSWTPNASVADTVQLLKFVSCIFDSTTGDNVDLNPGNSMVPVAVVTFTDTWIGGGGGHGIHVRNATPNWKVRINACEFYGNTGAGIRTENGIVAAGKCIIDPNNLYLNNTGGTVVST